MTDPNDDFNPHKKLQHVVEHIDQPEKFAKLFCNAAESQRSIDKVLAKKIRNMIKTDSNTIESIKKLQREVDKEDWKNFIKKIGLTGWSLFMASFGAIAALILRKLFP
ncbi:MAG TPA: hypothetical protein VGW78_07625 [Candidatus Babeliales bacterium]|jgi:hypothetical protein|nr:hypothetical protein [Candidatus Babeliales bacterium]